MRVCPGTILKRHPIWSFRKKRVFAAVALLSSSAPSCAFSSLPKMAASPSGSGSGGSGSGSGSSSNSYIDKLALILVRDRMQLVARSKGKTAFFTPGGKREPGEMDEEALLRECKEELTVDLVASSVQPYGVFSAQAFGKPKGTMVRMTCYSADYTGVLTANEEVEELRWITSSCPHENLTVTGIMLLEDLKSKDLID